MTIETRNSILDRYLPIIIAAIVNAVIVGIAYGKLDSNAVSESAARKDRDITLAADIMPLEQRVRVFVTRAEWDIRNNAADTQLRIEHDVLMQSIGDLKSGVRDLNSKLDAYILQAKK